MTHPYKKKQYTERITCRVDKATAEGILEIAIRHAKHRGSTDIRIADAVRALMHAGLVANGIHID